MSTSRAEELLAHAATEEDRTERHLYVAAALTALVAHRPIVVGGTAEDFYVGDLYTQTDLDLCGWLTPQEEEVLGRLGFSRDGRYWFHEASRVAVEFPESRIDGDEARVLSITRGGSQVAIIGVDDLYLDRLRQSTSESGPPGIQFTAALAIALANHEAMDWNYIERVLSREGREQPRVGTHMKSAHRRIRRELTKAIDRGIN